MNISTNALYLNNWAYSSKKQKKETELTKCFMNRSYTSEVQQQPSCIIIRELGLCTNKVSISESQFVEECQRTIWRSTFYMKADRIRVNSSIKVGIRLSNATTKVAVILIASIFFSFSLLGIDFNSEHYSLLKSFWNVFSQNIMDHQHYRSLQAWLVLLANKC